MIQIVLSDNAKIAIGYALYGHQRMFFNWNAKFLALRLLYFLYEQPTFVYKTYSTSGDMSFFKNEYIFSPCNGILSFDQHVEKSLYTIRSLRLSIVPLTLLK